MQPGKRWYVRFQKGLCQAWEINVSVDDGTATLRGTVKDRDSVRSAVVDAYQAGVRDVVSRLAVEEDTE